MDLIPFLRWLHILSGAAWLGEVVTINFVIIPALKHMDARDRPRYIRETFPRLFRLASILSLISVSSGITMLILTADWNGPAAFLASRWGLSITFGGSLALALTAFHFFVESRLEPIASSLEAGTPGKDIDKVIRILRVVPRVGLVVMIVIFISMMYTARGI